MRIDPHFTPAQLAEGRRNAAAALVHRLRGDADSAFRTLVGAESFTAAIHGLLDITSGALPDTDETRAALQRIAARHDGMRGQFQDTEDAENG